MARHRKRHNNKPPHQVESSTPAPTAAASTNQSRSGCGWAAVAGMVCYGFTGAQAALQGFAGYAGDFLMNVQANLTEFVANSCPMLQPVEPAYFSGSSAPLFDPETAPFDRDGICLLKDSKGAVLAGVAGTVEMVNATAEFLNMVVMRAAEICTRNAYEPEFCRPLRVESTCVPGSDSASSSLLGLTTMFMLGAACALVVTRLQRSRELPRLPTKVEGANASGKAVGCAIS